MENTKMGFDQRGKTTDRDKAWIASKLLLASAGAYIGDSSPADMIGSSSAVFGLFLSMPSEA